MKCEHRDCRDRRAVELTSIGFRAYARSLRQEPRPVTCTREPDWCECERGLKTTPKLGCVDCNRVDGTGHAQHDVIMILRAEGQPCSTRYIAEQASKSLNTVFMLLSRMRRNGLLRRSLRLGYAYDGACWNRGLKPKFSAPEAYWSLCG